jgi:hypothetical protein
MIRYGIYYYTSNGIFTGVRHYDDQVDAPYFPQPRQTHFMAKASRLLPHGIHPFQPSIVHASSGFPK